MITIRVWVNDGYSGEDAVVRARRYPAAKPVKSGLSYSHLRQIGITTGHTVSQLKKSDIDVMRIER
jgi:hypothetical protein